MAFDFTPVNYGALLGVGNEPDPRILRMKQQQVDAETQRVQAAVQKAQQEAQQQQLYQQAVGEVLSNPTPEGFAALQARFPDQAQAIKGAWETKEKAEQDADFKELAGLYGYLASGRADTAKQRLQGRINAGRAAGIDVSDDEELLAQIEADPTKARGFLGYVMSSIGGNEKFAAIQEQLRLAQSGGDPFTLGAGEIRYDANGNVIASSPYKPQLVTGPNGEIIEYTPGSGATGDPASVFQRMIGAESGGNQFTNGRTTTSSKGALGIAQVMPGTGPEAARLAGVEWSLDRLKNDPAYNRQLGEAYFGEMLRRFGGDTRKAVAAYNAGPARVERAVEKAGANWERVLPAETKDYLGKVLAGGGQGGTIRALTPGRTAEPAARRMSPEEVAAEGLDPNVVYYRDKNGVPQAVSGQTKQTAARQIPDGVAKRLLPQIEIRDTMNRLSGSFRNDFGGNALTGGLENTIQGLTGLGTPGQRDWWADFRAMDNQIRNQLFGSALTEHEKRAYEATTISPRMDPKEIRKNLQRRKQIVDAALARQQNFLKQNRYDPEAVDALFETFGSAPSSGWGKARRVQ